MNIFKSKINFITLILLVINFFCFSTLQAKKLNNFEQGNHISNYFAGIILLNKHRYKDSYDFLKKLEGLEKYHLNYSSKFIFSSVNLGKVNEAYYYSKKLEKAKLDNFESNLIIGIYYLKNNKPKLAKKYFLKLTNIKSNFIINDFISHSLLNWTSLNDLKFENAQDKILNTNSKFENLKRIQNVFLHCYYNSNKTEFFFENLIANKKIDFSRYNYFYAIYLSSIGKIDKAKQIVNSSLNLYPTNLLLNQYKINLDIENYEKDFDCQNPSHVIAEILYITANALSSQQIYKFSNFYLNLSKYLNKKFHSYDTLLAENFYKERNFKQAKEIYNKIGSRGSIFFWYSAKQKAKILIEEGKQKEALKNLVKAYEKLSNKNIYQKYDYAKYLKANEEYKKSIIYYSEIIQSITKDHPLYPKVTDGRGVAYERIGEWDKAQKDLLSSLEVSPDQAYVINYLAYSWIEKGIRIDKSLKMLEKANNLSSNDPYIIDSLGWALFKLKRYNESKKYLQIAVGLLPADPIINDHYADVLWKNGHKIQARYYWKYVLKLEETEKDLKEIIKNKLILGI